MMSQQFYNNATLLGTVLSLIGLIVALLQIRKALTAATAAQRAAARTEQIIARNVFLADVSTCVTAIEELKVLIRSARSEAALLRVTDLTANLIRVQHLRNAPDMTQIPFREILTQLAILREVLEQQLHTSATDLNPVRANSVLSKISDQLNHWVGGAKYHRDDGEVES